MLINEIWKAPLNGCLGLEECFAMCMGLTVEMTHVIVFVDMIKKVGDRLVIEIHRCWQT